MLDLKRIREETEAVRKALRNKGSDADLESVLGFDRQRREFLVEAENLKQKRNEVSKDIALRKRAGEEVQNLTEEMSRTGERIRDLDARIREIETKLNALMLEIPNIHHSSVPVGADEAGNVEVRRWGDPQRFPFSPLPHWAVGEKLGALDPERSGKISGARFVLLKEGGAKLERALINFMLDHHTQRNGYKEVYPPFLVRSDCMLGTGQLPKFGAEAFHCELDDLWLIPTAEVPVTNLHRDEILEPAMLPLKYVSYTACFRREAGAAGKDTRGIIRVHQFDKVELVKFVEPEKSYEELELLLADAEGVLQALGLPYRIVEICTGDLGFTAAKKYDPEVWFPGQERFIEVSSCSNFEDFQARRANIRYRPDKGAKPRFVHTLNGSGLAVGRTLAAILENYQQGDGAVIVPEVLRPYMGGMDVLACP